jgi:hypothetical protein
MRFSRLALFSSLLSLFLTGAWGLALNRVLSFLDVPYTPSAALVARRYGALYLAIAVILFLARNAERSPVRSALALGVAVGCGALAVLGLFELSQGHVGNGIWAFIAFEVVLAVAFPVVDRRDRGV